MVDLDYEGPLKTYRHFGWQTRYVFLKKKVIVIKNVSVFNVEEILCILFNTIKLHTCITVFCLCVDY